MNYQDIFFKISIIHIGHRTLAKDPINPKILFYLLYFLILLLYFKVYITISSNLATYLIYLLAGNSNFQQFTRKMHDIYSFPRYETFFILYATQIYQMQSFKLPAEIHAKSTISFLTCEYSFYFISHVLVTHIFLNLQ